MIDDVLPHITNKLDFFEMNMFWHFLSPYCVLSSWSGLRDIMLVRKTLTEGSHDKLGMTLAKSQIGGETLTVHHITKYCQWKLHPCLYRLQRYQILESLHVLVLVGIWHQLELVRAAREERLNMPALERERARKMEMWMLKETQTRKTPCPSIPEAPARFKLLDGVATLEAMEYYRPLPQISLGHTPLGYKVRIFSIDLITRY